MKLKLRINPRWSGFFAALAFAAITILTGIIESMGGCQ